MALVPNEPRYINDWSDAISLVAALFRAVKDAAARLAALGPFGPSVTARPNSAGWQ
jgi:hypothetical protein